MSFTDPETVRAQYADEGALEARRGVWHPTTDGRDPTTEALQAVEEHVAGSPPPYLALEVGCGTGAFAARLDALSGVEVLATDTSGRMVDLASRRGVAACWADAADLSFDDDAFAVVAAMWMLYHVPDLDAALAGIRRVLRPGGLLVAATNGEGHLRDLRVAAGGPPLRTSFSTQNGEAALRRHFDDVERHDYRTRAIFPDHATAFDYLRTSIEDVDWDLPAFDGPREYAGEVTVFLAR